MRADNTFSNSAAIISAGRVEAGLKFSRKLGQGTRLVGQAIETESLVNDGNLFGAQLGIEHTFSNQVKLEFGGRYAKESAEPRMARSRRISPDSSSRPQCPVPQARCAGLVRWTLNGALAPGRSGTVQFSVTITP
jgi:hypothetical protein